MKSCENCSENITNGEIYYIGATDAKVCDSCYYQYLNNGFNFNGVYIDDHIDEAVGE